MESGFYLNSRTTSVLLCWSLLQQCLQSSLGEFERVRGLRALGCFDPTCNKKMSDSLDRGANWLTYIICPTLDSGQDASRKCESQASIHQISDLAPATSIASGAVLPRCSIEKVSGFEKPGGG